MSAFDFATPLLLIMSGLCVSIPLSMVLSQCAPSTTSSSKHNDGWFSNGVCVGIGVLHGVGTACQNISLHETSLSLNQLIKCMSPAFTILLSYVLLGYRYHWSLMVATLFVIGGSILTTYTTPMLSMWGFWTGIGSTVLGAFEVQSVVMGFQRVQQFFLKCVNDFKGVLSEYVLVFHHLSVPVE